MAVTPVHTTLTVTTAGTRVQCTADTDIKPSSVYFESVAGTIYVGLVTVTNAIYIAKLAAGVGFTLEADGKGGSNFRAGGQGIQLSNIYIDGATNADKCQMTYLYATGG